MRTPTTEEARAFIDHSGFVWHQRWELSPGVVTPGPNDIGWLLHKVGLPTDLSGKSVIDIGTTNGAAAFEAERRGAERVVAVDIFPPQHYGVAALTELLDSRVEFVRANIYGLSALAAEAFDVVLFLGVLYHLRHPLLALDEVRALTRELMLLETAVCDHELGDCSGQSVARFYRRDELGSDPSNWFAPSARTLIDWCASSGFDADLVGPWPADAPERAGVRGTPTPGAAEWLRLSYERPLRVQVNQLANRW